MTDPEFRCGVCDACEEADFEGLEPEPCAIVVRDNRIAELEVRIATLDHVRGELVKALEGAQRDLETALEQVRRIKRSFSDVRLYLVAIGRHLDLYQ